MRHVFNAPSWLAAITLFILMGMTFLDVIMRSTINNPIEASTELTRLFMAIIVFSSLPMVTWRGEHIIVDLLDPLFNKTAARIRDFVIDTACGILLLWPAKRVFDLAERARSYGDTTEYLQIPQFYIGWFIAFSTAVTALVLLIRALTRLMRPGMVEGIEKNDDIHTRENYE